MMKLKRRSLVLVTAVVLALTFVLSGCGNGRDATKLYVGMEVGYPPMEMVANDGTTVVGFDVDVANEIAKRLGKTGGVEIVQTAWDGIFSALETDKFDCIISAVSINPDRTAAHSLTKAYVANKLVIVTKKGNKTIKSPTDIKTKKVGVQQSTTSENYCKDNGIKYSPYQKVTQPFADLKIGRLDAVVVDIVVAAYYLTEDAKSYQVVWESPDAEPMAIAFQKKDTATRDKVNTILDAMQADGTLSKLSIKWFTKDITKNLD